MKTDSSKQEKSTTNESPLEYGNHFLKKEGY